MDEKDAEILDLIQRGVPLVRDPWSAIGSRVSLPPPAVAERITAIRSGGRIREISGIFDCVSLGYSQALVALRIPRERRDAAGETVAVHPGVGHCYARDGEYNLWFTLAVSPESGFGLAGTARRLSELVSASGSMLLPTLQRFKLSTIFMPSGEVADPADAPGRGAPPVPAVPGAEDRRAVRALQTDLPAVPDPFARVAAGEGIASADVLLETAAAFTGTGRMRRYAAVVYHRAMGAVANAMVVWRVDSSRLAAAGAAAAGDPAVSHCYARPAYPDWPFSLYTMVHGSSAAEVGRAVARIARSAALDHDDGRRVLWTSGEYAKRRVKLFTPAEAAWEKSIA